MLEVKLYVGLNDSETLRQEYDTRRYVDILKKVCENYHVAFSFHPMEGGYMHEDGRYTEETSLVLTLIDPKEGIVDEIARDLCVFFHQESVMITEDEVRSYFVNESVEADL